VSSVKNSRLSRIDFLFPRDTPEELSFFESIASLLAEAPGARRLEGEVIFTPANPAKALPFSSLRNVGVEYPEIVLETDRLVDVSVGRLRLRSSAITNGAKGGLFEADTMDRELLPIGELCHRLSGHLTGIDHMGINIPEDTLGLADWRRLLQDLSAVSAMYKYQTDKPWPFIIPTTQEEFEGEIQDFVVGRAPRFELVYESRDFPLLQFSVRTNLDQKQLIRMFPEPHGTLLPEVGQFFRSVHVAHPWQELENRFDLYYRSEKGTLKWETGEELVTKGGRIRWSRSLAAE
jgi:hypothetical protein